MRLIGREDLIGDERLKKCDDINANGLNPEVVGILDEAFKKFTRDELLTLFKANDLACEGAYEPLDIYEDEQVWANGILKKIPYPSGERNVPSSPVNFASNPDPAFVVGGSQGAHTVELMEHLGYSREEIEKAIADGDVEGEKKLRKL